MRARGFTLLEVMVAIAIFALLGAASYSVLTGVMQTDERLAARAAQLRAINRALWVMQQDVEQLLPRNVRDATGAMPALPNYLVVNAEAELPLQLTRGGRSNPLALPRSSQQRVAYRVGPHPGVEDSESPHYQDEHTYLLRYLWSDLDGAGATERAQVQIVLADVAQMAVSVLTNAGTLAEWPPAERNGESGQDVQPAALQIELTLAEGSTLAHSFKIW